MSEKFEKEKVGVQEINRIQTLGTYQGIGQQVVKVYPVHEKNASQSTRLRV